MTPPPLLCAATLLFWGWQTSLWPFAIVLALLLEAPRLSAWRFDLSLARLARLFDFGLLLAIAVTGYIAITGSATLAVVLALQWLPVALAPFVVAQAWSPRGGIDLKALWSNRQRYSPSPGRPYPADFRWLYLPICAVAASAANVRTPLFFVALALGAAWALYVVRPRRIALPAWTGLLLLVTALGYGGQIGLNRLQALLVDLSMSFLLGAAENPDPYRSRTALGEIGELKLSGEIVLRVTPAVGEAAPDRLPRATYDSYSGGAIWYAEGAELTDMRAPPAGSPWQLVAGAGRHVLQIAATLRGERALLTLPPGTRSLADLDVERLRRNRFGVVEVTPHRDGQIVYSARYGPGEAAVAGPPSAADFAVNDTLVPLLARIAAPLGLDGMTAAQASTRIATWFASRFTYSLYEPGNAAPGRSAIERFLLETRAGHCEYFATATVLLLRHAGVPARYVTGFAVQEWSDLEQAYVVRRRDAHAWARAYIGGRWVDVDTTPANWPEAERVRAAWWRPLSDRWDWLAYRVRGWLATSRDTRLVAAWSLLLVPPLAWLAWRLRRRAVPTGSARSLAGASGHLEGKSPFLYLEMALHGTELARAPGELATRWAERVARGLGDDDLLVPLLGCVDDHYRHRFAQGGLAPDAYRRFVARVESCRTLLRARRGRLSS